jgi:tetratricopeptide (TPR) repeat protein
MEYAYTKGMRCHRDIKPGNIMISQDKTVKISDFGLAGVFGACKRISSVRLSFADGQVGLSGRTMEGTGFGTPTHMPPEQFTKAASCDERSDIYSFGITLYQMATGGRIPFLAPLPRDNSGEEMARFWMDMKTLHSESPLPQLSTPLFHIIQRCLEKSPDKRYKRFLELRSELEPLLRQETGEVIKPQEIAELGGREWSNKGISLDSLGRYEEAIQCYDKAIELDPRWAGAWIGKANSLNNLGRYEEAIHWCDKAIEVEPRYTFAWNNKGNALNSLGRYEEAIQCYDKAIELDPQLAMAWNNKGSSLDSLGRHGEAIRCYEKALEFDPRNAAAWTNKGDSLQSLGRYEEAILCCDKALEYDPRLAAAWFNKAFSEDKLGRGQDAARSYRQFLALVPPKYAKEIEHARQRLRELEG